MKKLKKGDYNSFLRAKSFMCAKWSTGPPLLTLYCLHNFETLGISISSQLWHLVHQISFLKTSLQGPYVQNTQEYVGRAGQSQFIVHKQVILKSLRFFATFTHLKDSCAASLEDPCRQCSVAAMPGPCILHYSGAKVHYPLL